MDGVAEVSASGAFAKLTLHLQFDHFKVEVLQLEVALRVFIVRIDVEKSCLFLLVDGVIGG